MHKLIFILSRSPLHVGTNQASEIIDQPVLRERHTGFPIVPGSTLKGAFARAWADPATGQRSPEGIDFFGGTQPGNSTPGALQFTEAKLLAFPVRSARGAYAWITSPLALRRLARDGGMAETLVPATTLRDEYALFQRASPMALSVGPETKIVLEDYTFHHAGELPVASGEGGPPEKTGVRPGHLGELFAQWLASDAVWREVAQKLVVVSDTMMAFFARFACEVVQHLAIDESTGIAVPGTLSGQENVPAETLFYATMHCLRPSRGNRSDTEGGHPLELAAQRLHGRIFQFGSDASTGLGLCSVELAPARGGRHEKS